jgi:hypothetical protein
METFRFVKIKIEVLEWIINGPSLEAEENIILELESVNSNIFETSSSIQRESCIAWVVQVNWADTWSNELWDCCLAKGSLIAFLNSIL